MLVEVALVTVALTDVRFVVVAFRNAAFVENRFVEVAFVIVAFVEVNERKFAMLAKSVPRTLNPNVAVPVDIVVVARVEVPVNEIVRVAVRS